jgi:GNAT superfamily N-acetyltransferase
MKIFEITEESVNYVVEPSTEYSQDQLVQIAALIAHGGEVSAETVLGNLMRAPLIGSAFMGETAIGAVVLKQPNPSYRSKVFASAGVSDLESQFRLEVGYVYVLPEFRHTGAGMRLMQAVNRKLPPNVFATSREENTLINTVLRFAGFKKTGEPYSSARGDYQLLLWTR